MLHSISCVSLQLHLHDYPTTSTLPAKLLTDVASRLLLLLDHGWDVPAASSWKRNTPNDSQCALKSAQQGFLTMAGMYLRQPGCDSPSGGVMNQAAVDWE